MGVDGDNGPYSSQTAANTHAPWVEGGTPLDVDLAGLRDYAKHMADQQRDLMSRTTHLSHLFKMPGEAYNGEVLGEAAYLRSQLQANASELSAYLNNLGQTLFNIGSAAQTIADIYGSGDATGAADLADVLFAFGDKSVPRPDGLPPYLGQTYQEALLANAAKTAPPPETSAEWQKPEQTSTSPYQTTLTSKGPNGLVRETVTTNVPGSGVSIVTTTIYDSKGKVVNTTTSRTTTTYDYATNSQVQTVESGNSTTRTTTQYGKDGSIVNSESASTTSTNGHETPTGRRVVTVDPQTGERVETTYVVRDGKEVVSDRVVIGRATKGETGYEEPIANKYDPMSPTNG
ncbi:hypothetical protein MRQ36_21680 [Micromonospora sp. R77]|uniref:hypothetical protein n=1 Tax=Micromonospora sp. R77 TaxID=2925836 RepID=UPI001F603D83|nr:hypothetical protein [Micromonospora sp. R77]MCI4065030.1 hypothetical protein [Micromonospora sp. R77]